MTIKVKFVPSKHYIHVSTPLTRLAKKLEDRAEDEVIERMFGV